MRTGWSRSRRRRTTAWARRTAWGWSAAGPDRGTRATSRPAGLGSCLESAVHVGVHVAQEIVVACRNGRYLVSDLGRAVDHVAVEDHVGLVGRVGDLDVVRDVGVPVIKYELERSASR